jgi:imidazolonepropionase
MPTTVITNIKQLVNVRKVSHLLRGKELAQLPTIQNAYLIIEDGIIAGYGSMNELKIAENKLSTAIDAVVKKNL